MYTEVSNLEVGVEGQHLDPLVVMLKFHRHQVIKPIDCHFSLK